MVAGSNACRVVGGHRDRERHLDDSARERPGNNEAGLREDAQHRLVVRDDLGDEARDSLLGGTLRQLLEQTRANPAPLVAVGDCEGDLGYFAFAKTHVTGQGDDSLTIVG